MEIAKLHYRAFRDHDLRHPRPGRSDDAGGSHRRSEQRPHRTGRHAPATLSRAGNRFVAAFIGSPRMNFLAVPATGSRVDGPGSLALDVALADRSATTAEIGVRPEALTITGAGQGKIRGVLERVEDLGHEHLAYVRIEPDAIWRSGASPARHAKPRSVAGRSGLRGVQKTCSFLTEKAGGSTIPKVMNVQQLPMERCGEAPPRKARALFRALLFRRSVDSGSAFRRGWPLMRTLFFAFTDAYLDDRANHILVGFRNFVDVAQDPLWWQAVRNTLLFTASRSRSRPCLALPSRFSCTRRSPAAAWSGRRS